jgi:hypothetical protein
MSYVADVDGLRGGFSALAEEFARFQGVSDVFDWMKRANLTRAAVDIIGQDEFEYDFLIQLPSGDWIEFGIT